MEPGTLTVGELARGVETALNAWFPGELWVSGEIANLKRSSNGHVYFQLVERDDASRTVAAIGVVLLDSARRYVNAQLNAAGGMRMTDGTQVRIRGRLEAYAPQARLQLRMSGIDPAFTLALLESERDRVVARLRADGLLSRNAQATLAPVPLRVGLATSDGSAAMADFVHELRASGFAWRICFAHVPVQGHRADELIADAIDRLVDADVDVVVLVRGGGSRLDLSVFDSEVLGRAIAAAPVPVFTGIGHEIDTSVADVVAHSSFKTPTACAAALVEHVGRELERAEQAWRAITSTARTRMGRLDDDLVRELRSLPRLAHARVAAATGRVEGCARSLADRATRGLSRERARVLRHQHELRPTAQRTLDRMTSELAVAEATVDASDPVRLMRRGWSVLRTSAGSVVRSATEVAPGDRLVTSLADGTVESDAVGVHPSIDTNESTT